MPSQVSICNRALVKLAQDVAIASITENTKAARVLNRTWADVRDLVLADHVWPFALKAAPLEPLVEDPFPGWAYRYAYPAECLTAVSVTSACGVRVGMSALSRLGLDGDWRRVQYDGRAEFEVTYGDQSTSIATDMEEAYLIQVVRVGDVSRWPTLFADAVAARLAHEVAPAIMGELGLRAQGSYFQAYQDARSQAIAHGMNESRETRTVTTPGMLARG